MTPEHPTRRRPDLSQFKLEPAREKELLERWDAVLNVLCTQIVDNHFGHFKHHALALNLPRTSAVAEAIIADASDQLYKLSEVMNATRRTVGSHTVHNLQSCLECTEADAVVFAAGAAVLLRHNHTDPEEVVMHELGEAISASINVVWGPERLGDNPLFTGAHRIECMVGQAQKMVHTIGGFAAPLYHKNEDVRELARTGLQLASLSYGSTTHALRLAITSVQNIDKAMPPAKAGTELAKVTL